MSEDAASAGKVVLDVVANEKPFTSALEGIGNVAGKIGKKIAGVFAVTSLASFSKECISAAAAAQQTSNRVAAVFPKMQAQVDAFASSAMEKMGMSAGAAKKMTASFGMMAQGMGYSEKASAEMGTTMTKLAGDMAAFYGMTTDEAESKLSGVFTGMTRGMKSLGVNMSEANLQAHALSLGISKSVSDMSEAELASLRLSYAQQQLAKTGGYAQRNLGTWAGQTQYLSQQMGKLKSTLGQALIAALLPVLKVVNAVISGVVCVAQAINALIEAVTGRKMGELMGSAAGVTVDLGDAADYAADSAGDLADAQGSAAKAAKAQEKAQKALNRTLAGFDKINKLSSQSADAAADSGAGSGASGALGSVADQIAGAAGFGDAMAEQADIASSALSKIKLPPALVAAFKKLKDAIEGVVAAVKTGLKWVWDKIVEPFASWLVSKVLPPVVRGLSGIVRAVTGLGKALGRVFGNIWDRYLSKAAKWLGDVIVGALEAVADWLEACGQWWEDHEEEIDAAIDGFFDGLDAIVGEIARFLLPALKKAWKFLKPILKDVARKLSDLVKNGVGKLGEGVEAVRKGVDAFRKSWESVKDRAAELVADAHEKSDGALAALSGAWEAVKDKAAELVATAVDKGASVVEGVRAAWGAVQTRTAELVATARASIEGAWDKVKSAFDNAKSWLSNKAGTITGTLKGVVGGAWDKARSAFDWAKANLRKRAATVKATVKAAVAKTWNTAKSAFKWAVSGLFNKARTISGTVQTYGMNLFNGLKKAFDWAKGNLKDKIATIGLRISSALTDPRSLVNNAIASINSKLHSLYWPSLKVGGATVGGGQIFPGSASNWPIPQLAKGGWVEANTPQLAVIGDNRHAGEVVAPEPKMQEMADRAAQGARSDMSTVEALLRQLIAAVKSNGGDVYLDGKAITRAVVRNVNRQTQATGRCPVIV